MLFQRRVLDAIVRGDVTLAFRRWRRSPPSPGSTLRTPVGVLSLDGVRVIQDSDVTEQDAKRSGAASRSELLASLPAEGALIRIELRYLGADPRARLRDTRLTRASDVREVLDRLQRIDARAPEPWTRRLLELIGQNPGLAARHLAELATLDTPLLKQRVRKLKELGLTESLETGYRLAARGQDALASIAAAARPASGAPRRPARGSR